MIPITPYAKFRIDIAVKYDHADVSVVLDERYVLSVNPVPTELVKVKAALDALGIDHVWTDCGGIVVEGMEVTAEEKMLASRAEGSTPGRP